MIKKNTPPARLQMKETHAMLKSLAIGLLTLSTCVTAAAFADDHGGSFGDQQDFQQWLTKCEGDSSCDRVEDTVETDWWQLGPKQWQDLLAQCEKDSTCDSLEDQLEANGYVKDGDDDGQGNNCHHPAAAPEIDPAGAMGALTLLAGGLAALRGRRSAKNPA